MAFNTLTLVQPISTHTRFVRDVAYSPNGDTFASVGSDGKLFLYEGKEGEIKGEVDVHQGSAVSFSLTLQTWAHV